MKTCKKCNLSYDDDKKFCKECGDPLTLEHKVFPKGLAFIIVGIILVSAISIIIAKFFPQYFGL